MGKVIRGGGLCSEGAGVGGVFVGIDQHGLANGVGAAILKGCYQVGRILVICGEQQGVAMGEGLHVGHLEIFGELGYQVGITTGNVQ